MHYRVWIIIAVLLMTALVLASCGQSGSSPMPLAQEPGTSGAEPGERTSHQWNQLLSRDAIRPIYDPEFVPASEAAYSDDELIMGVSIGGEAKAYPVGLLNNREMVNDELAGTPILVTW